MSGGGTGGGQPPEEPIKNCASISFNTDINSPQEDALEDLQEQDILDVVLNDNKIIVVRQDTGSTVGSINWSSIRRLIECIQDGYEYTATVRSIQDGLIKVHISVK